MTPFRPILTLALWLCACPAWADEGLDLARAKNCLACHAVAAKVVGPAYQDIAARYAADKDAESRLIQKVRHGGSGAWGVVPMPANTQISEAQARTLVRWVLSQRRPAGP